MPLTLCTCTLKVRDALGGITKFTSAELTCEPRKTQVNSADAAYISRPIHVQADNTGLCTVALAETTTNNQLVTFRLDWDDSGKNQGSIVFDPILIPNQSTLDLSTILTVSRG